MRIAPGTDAKAKSYNQLTADAKKHAYATGTLKTGTKLTCKAVQNVGDDVWIQIPSGWIAAVYNGTTYVV